MKKIRIGNDFVFNWAIERGGLPEDLSSVLEKHLHLSVFGKRVELVEGVDYDINGNVIRIEVTPAIANIIGTYNVEFHYILPDTSLSDEDRKCAIDVDAFQIVAKTAQADDSSEFSVTSDMAIAFKGDKGDSAYEVWLKDNPDKTKEDYYNWLQKPATDIAETVGLQEQERVEAENTRRNNEEQRVTAETNRQNNFNSFIEVSESAVNTFIGTAQGDINEAISNAENATENANTAAQNANDARLAIQDDLELKADHGYSEHETPKTLKEIEDEKANQTDLEQLAGDVKETTEKPTAQSLSELNARITALEAILSNKIKDRVDVTKEFNVWGKTNLILYGDGASTKTPDFIGQTYIDTTNSNVYIAVGTSNAGNWKLV